MLASGKDSARVETSGALFSSARLFKVIGVIYMDLMKLLFVLMVDFKVSLKPIGHFRNRKKKNKFTYLQLTYRV